MNCALLRTGEALDADDASRLIEDSAVDLFREYTQGNIAIWRQIAIREWVAESGIYSHRFSTVACRENKVVGLLTGFSPSEAASIDRTLTSSRLTVSADWERLDSIRASLSYLFPVNSATSYYIQNLAVDDGFQKLGIGKLLVENAIACALANGIETCHLDVASKSRSIVFYEKLGFRKVVITEVVGFTQLGPYIRMEKRLV